MNEKIIRFLKDHPMISVNMLEQKSGVPFTTIAQAMIGVRKIPQKYHAAIIQQLHDYGYQR